LNIIQNDWAGRSLQSSGTRIDAYAKTVHERLDQVAQSSGGQPGDPVRAAEVIITAVNSDDPPLNLVLGASGHELARERLTKLTAEFDRWEAVTISANYPKAKK
jgi:hypothetical protein